LNAALLSMQSMKIQCFSIISAIAGHFWFPFRNSDSWQLHWVLMMSSNIRPRDSGPPDLN
jgi:hypothetical protein